MRGKEILKWLFVLGFIGGISGVLLLGGVFAYFSTQVPDFRSLADYRPSLITKVYSSNGEILGEYARERRVYLPITDIPQDLINAFLAAEDTSFYEHHGYDMKGILRAALVNVFTDRKQGASTITQQVAKTFLLSNERTYKRKIKELILARRIEDAFSKNEILELYLNQIYLGNGAYGVGAAALAYFGKSVDELTVGERAMLAGLPKAPSSYNPVYRPAVARQRRDIVVRRMETEGFITKEQADEAVASDLVLRLTPMANGEKAPFFAEHVRRELLDRYGENALYEGGLATLTTLDMELQRHAEKAVQTGLRSYDRRHGWRGPVGRLTALTLDWQNRIKDEAEKYRHLQDFAVPAAVLEVSDAAATIGLENGTRAQIPLAGMTWARKYIDATTMGDRVRKASDVLQAGDIVFVQRMDKNEGFEKVPDREKKYSLEQLPAVQGALVAIDVATGAVKAMVGGFDSSSDFNRAVQAKRQVGSAFKPFVYAAALEQGYTPASIILDAPVVLRSGDLDDAWKPQNYSAKVYGPSTMRLGLEKSRNLMTIRLAQDIGIRKIIDFASRFGFDRADMHPNLATALGASSLSLLDLTAGYRVFANGGVYSKPYLIERIQDATGQVIWQHHPVCSSCTGLDATPTQSPPSAEEEGERLVTPEIAYQMTDMLRGVVLRGTGMRARAVGRPVGGKTGTTNDYIDAWFEGYSPTLATGVWVGFDQPQPMGNSETGSRAALPIWVEFMQNALKNRPKADFTIPEGVTFARIDAVTGKPPTANTTQTLLEVFIKGTEPTTGSLATGRVLGKRGSDGNTEEPANLLSQGIY
ncbi:MAG: PBP1A family penicillin-binding protein [Proteobacteria bacterium]|nr:PBP1A family penicillin-binding protein [Pseudomonadota bacterium]